MRDARADTPGAANTIVRMLKLLLNFGSRKNGLRRTPPMAMLKVGESHAWTDEEY
jgi:hypothetical protein